MPDFKYTSYTSLYFQSYSILLCGSIAKDVLSNSKVADNVFLLSIVSIWHILFITHVNEHSEQIEYDQQRRCVGKSE